jgi:peptide/nickel transport system substrate-binding protein
MMNNADELRLAFNLAVDRHKLIREGFYGYANPVPALTPPWALDFPEGLQPRPHAPELARQLFIEVEGGWPDGRVLQLATLKPYERAARLIASDIQTALQISVEVTVVPPGKEVEWKRVLAEKKLVPNWDIFLADAFALFSEATPAFFHREFFGSDGAFRAGPENPQFNQLFSTMAAQIDQKELLKMEKKSTSMFSKRY